VAAIHFPEAVRFLHRFWKMDGPDEPGHDASHFALDMRFKTKTPEVAFRGFAFAGV
jgi:hypothetical protein